MIIRTERLVLRRATAEDLPTIHAILGNAQACAFWSSPPHRSLEQSREWLLRMIAIPTEEGEDFVVEHDGAVIGKAGFYRFPEIGFIFHPNAWGQGFAGEALQVIIARGFDLHGLRRVEADVDPRNAACLTLLTKLGFKEVGRRERTWLIGDEWSDSVDLALNRQDWQRRAMDAHIDRTTPGLCRGKGSDPSQ